MSLFDSEKEVDKISVLSWMSALTVNAENMETPSVGALLFVKFNKQLFARVRWVVSIVNEFCALMPTSFHHVTPSPILNSPVSDLSTSLFLKKLKTDLFHSSFPLYSVFT